MIGNKAAGGYTCQLESTLSDQDAATLGDILVRLVADGHSLGFNHPLSPTTATAFFKEAIANKHIRLLVARDQQNDTIVGTVQLDLAAQENAQHRAEVKKLLVNPDHHRKGVATLLLGAADELARKEGRLLLVLDTWSHGTACALYRKCGWIEIGDIPNFARNHDGRLCATKLFYKQFV
ncbi:acyl-CoA N-acyltransferase [Powellomyces hirtus]|nr:acyl-CoA N-acyltransferase [Powellomyces hirtus]